MKPIFPEVNEVKDLSSGCAVAAVIHYYCPGLLRLEGIPKLYNMCLTNRVFQQDADDNLTVGTRSTFFFPTCESRHVQYSQEL